MATLTSATLQVYIYEGLEGSFSEPQYTLFKEKLSFQEDILFEVSELVRDFITHDFNNDYLSTVKWVSTVATLLDENGGELAGSPVTQSYLTKDGFGDFEDEINPQLSTDLLQSNDIIYLPDNTEGKIPVFAEGVGSVVIDGSTTTVADNGNSNQKIQYLTIPANGTSIIVKDKSNTTIRTLAVKRVCEPKYTPYKVTFVNKEGAYQDIWFFKRSDERLTVVDTKFKTNTINETDVTFPTNKPQEQRDNVNAKKGLVLNTGFLNESFNTVIEQLILSENVWVRYKGRTLPVTVKDRSLDYKTSVNDKLINYTIGFDYAFDKFNTIL